MELNGTSKINGLLVHVENEDATFDVDIPIHKVEKGLDLTDHVEPKPDVIRLSGILVRPTKERVENLIAKLQKIEKEGWLVTYEGRRIYTNMLLHNLNIRADKTIINGFRFSCTLIEARIAQSSYVPPKMKAVTATVSLAGRKQTVNKKISPIYHIVKRGDTYIALGKKYNVKWQQLQAWNGYAPTSIPVGAKIRVG